ncbi:MAG TPA: malto-oligosyltrehalose synthase [Opitutaceae bacterium]|nr:malto-oligosyltrehalose synthase [Opitutaceae bacterium]
MRDDWIATYRLQLRADFPLAAAGEILPYLAALGISHVYLSPCLQAVQGSAHGYDVVDPTRISADLGGEEAWRAFRERASGHGLGILLDIVPNHMAASAQNPWWDDVLAHGPYSIRVPYFDIVPRPDDPGWRVHLAMLGRPYGEALAAGDLKVELREGRPRLTYFEHSWPLGPASWRLLLGGDYVDEPELCELERLGRLEEPGSTDHESYRRHHRQAEGLLRRAIAEGAFSAAIARFQGHPGRLHELLERQFYALHDWQLAGEVVNYRRFFDIGSLVGLRVESEPVFEAAHARIEGLLAEGGVDGLRVDHPDGLRDPAGYFARLRRLLPQGRIYLEKILDNDEQLRAEWPVDGTVGYEFLSKVNRLWMNDQKADALNGLYADFTRQPVNFLHIVREKKRSIVESSFSSDLDRLVQLAQRIARASWKTHDLSRRQLAEALKRLTVLLPVYRSYRGAGPAQAADRRILEDVFVAARGSAPALDPAVLAFLEGVLLQEDPGDLELDFIARWQQLTPGVTAKGVEDTTFYCYDRLVSCNEVGAQASLLGISAEKFHEFCHALGDRWPGNLLATSTHDNKRSEDVRARISVLTELTDRWGEALQRWSQMNEPAWRNRAPDRHAEYLLYQTLIGAWPIDQERCWQYMLKACREAKIQTSWHKPNAGYEASIRGFIAGVFASAEFKAEVERFVAQVLAPGRVNSLAQVLIKMTAPGVPDFFQGSELWDLSLVDPDNRRPVDFAERTRLLGRLAELTAPQAMAQAEAGVPKLWMIQRTLALRQKHPECFAGDQRYQPIIAQGTRLGHLLAYRRGERLIVVVPRFTLTLQGDWADTRLRLPMGEWRNRFTGERLAGDISPSALFGDFPVALLLREEAA